MEVQEAEAAALAAALAEEALVEAALAARAPAVLAVPVPEDLEVHLVIITIITVPVLVGALVRAAITAGAEDVSAR